jgi:hypothetical protein
MDTPKYNRTFHFPFSPGASSDDKIATSMEKLIGVPIICSEKLDGGNCSLETNGVYARTHVSIPTHASFDLIKVLHATIKHKIPMDYQLFGENCYAKHSIEYSELPGYFLLFGVRTGNQWLSWEEVKMWAEEIGVPTVPVLWEGVVKSKNELQQLIQSFMGQPSACGGIREGVVARVASGFNDDEFQYCVLKNVRKNHVNTNQHWTHNKIIKNKLKTDA